MPPYRPFYLALLGLLGSALGVAADAVSGFVSVSDGSFVLNGQPFQPTGTNQCVLVPQQRSARDLRVDWRFRLAQLLPRRPPPSDNLAVARVTTWHPVAVLSSRRWRRRRLGGKLWRQPGGCPQHLAFPRRLTAVAALSRYSLMTNTYFGGESAGYATATLDAAQALGLNVVRTWAFCDGPRQGALQPAPGVLEESVAVSLDNVLMQASERGLRLILVLTNHWSDYGGAGQYVSWAESATGESLSGSADAFFTSPACRALYRQYVTSLLSRVNSLTGLAYADDPAIFAWELINEPRIDSDPGGDILQAWLEEMASFVKAAAPRHLLAIGQEGFFGPSTPDLQSINPYSSSNGNDWVRNSAIATVDFTTAHSYPDQWQNCDDSCDISFATGWYQAHVRESAALGKPFIMEEFGAKSWVRYAMFSAVLSADSDAAASKRGGSGVCFWLLAPSSVPDYDGYTVYPDSAEADLIASHTAQLAEQGGGGAATA